MNAAKLIVHGINLSMALMVFGVALSAGPGQLRAAIRDPGLLARSLVAMFVVMPLFAVLIALNFELHRSLLVALMLLALSPVPPILPTKQIKAGGSTEFVIGLLVVSALAAILIAPAGVTLIGRIFGQDLHVPLGPTAGVVATSVLIPIVAGLLLARVAPTVAGRIAKPVLTASAVLLFALLVPVLFTTWKTLVGLAGDFTIVALLVFVGVGLLAGHLLGGPDPDNRTVLALATATRHPGVPIAVLHVIEPDNKAVAPIVLLYLIVAIVGSLPYVKWRSRAHARAKGK